MKIVRMISAVVAVGICAMAACANATTVSYTVTTWSDQYPAPTDPPEGSPWGSDGYPGDTVTMATYTGTLDLTPGTYELKINTLDWLIDYTYGGTETEWDYPDHWSELFFDITAVRDISFDGGPTGSLSQTGSLHCTWDNDFLSIDEGSTSSFTVGGFRVDVTPLGIDEFGGTDFPGAPYGNPWAQPSRDVMAEFVVTAIPEPGTMLFAGLGLLALLWKRKK
jgi:hypothetical protein